MVNMFKYIGLSYRDLFEMQRWYNCVTQSQHYAEVAFDVGQTLSNQQRTILRNVASTPGLWSYVELSNLLIVNFIEKKLKTWYSGYEKKEESLNNEKLF